MIGLDKVLGTVTETMSEMNDELAGRLDTIIDLLEQLVEEKQP